MTVKEVFQFIGISLIPIAVTILLYYGFEHIEKRGKKDINKLPKFLRTEKGRYWFRQIFTGLILGGFSIGLYFIGVEVKDYITGSSDLKIGISTFFPVLAGFIFGWPSAVTTTVIATIFRMCTPSFLRWPTVIACILGGGFSAAASHWFLDDKRSHWFNAFLGGLFVEALNLLFLFLFNLSSISDAFKTIRQFDIVCLLCNACCAAITCLIIQIQKKEKVIVNIKKDKTIGTRVQAWLLVICFLSLGLSTTSAYIVSFSDAHDNSVSMLNHNTYDIHNDFLLMRSQTSPTKCTERHIVSESGYCLVLTADDKDTTLEGTTESGTEKFTFHGKNKIVGIPKNVTEKYNRQMHDSFKFDDGKTIDQMPLSYATDDFKTSTFNFFYENVWGESCLIAYTKERLPSSLGSDANFYCLTIIPSDEIYISAGISFRVDLYVLILVFIILFALIDILISKSILKNIQIMDTSLEKIMEGDLNEEIKLVGTYKEFHTLSDNMNLTVGALKNYAAEVEHRMEAELKVARDIQVGLLPTYFPVEKEYNLYALMNTAKEVGGDFYDYIKMNNGRILILNADVSGKGVPAAMFMVRAKTLFKSLSSTLTDLGEIVSKANDELCQENDSGMFVTAWLGIFNPETGELDYINAGHTVPLIKREGKFQVFPNKHRIALAALPGTKYEVESTYLEPGDELLLYTDGVTEANNEKGKMFGIDKLINTANKSNYFNAKQLLTEISDKIAKFTNGVEQFDDITMLLLRYTGNKELNPENTLTLIAKPISTSVAVNYVESVLASRELNQKFIARISIVIDELFANVAYYAYPKGKEKDVTVTVDTRDDLLKIRLIDSGIPFDPTAKENPDVTATIDERKRGGLGIFIVKNTMDEVRYEYKNFQNILYLNKKINPEDKINKNE